MSGWDSLQRFKFGLRRRSFLGLGAGLVAWSRMPRHAFAGERDPRLIVVILRGAMDGLAVVPPIGDPRYESLRADLAIGVAGLGEVLPLDGYFGLNVAMPALHARYRAGDALIVHATATPYRDRSHFDGQDVLESGMPYPRDTTSGWLNRVVSALPAGDSVRPERGLAINPTVPLIFRGTAPTLTWTPPNFEQASQDTIARLMALYATQDPQLASALAEGEEISMLAASDVEMAEKMSTVVAFREAADGAAKLLSAPDGPRLAALSYDGWDTHADEGVEKGKLARQLKALDGALEALAVGLEPVWQDTVIVVATEFGRTARVNGNEGTDHGTATTAFVIGGAVKGGHVLADWPGLDTAQLYEGRDLAPTTDLRAVLKGILRDHLGLSERVLAQDIFPGSLGVRPISGIVA